MLALELCDRTAQQVALTGLGIGMTADLVRFGLRAPGPGLVWVRDGGRFLLVRIATGAVVAVR